jgi:hypothetical protein
MIIAFKQRLSPGAFGAWFYDQAPDRVTKKVP